MCNELQAEVARRFLKLRWLPSLAQQKPEDVASIIRIDGDVPDEAMRAKLAEELRKPGTINLNPGTSPVRQAGLPTIYFDPDGGIRLVQIVQVVVPSLNIRCPAKVSVQVVGDDLLKELHRLAGPDWEKQPLLPDEQYPTQFAGFKYEFRVKELDLQKSLPPITPAPPA